MLSPAARGQPVGVSTGLVRTMSFPSQRPPHMTPPTNHGRQLSPGADMVDHVVTKTFLPRRDILLGIIPSSTKYNDSIKGKPCTLFQRSSSDYLSGDSDRSHDSVNVSPHPPQKENAHDDRKFDSTRFEGITRQQLQWLEQQEIKPGHFTEAYIRNLQKSNRPLFSLKKMEVKERERVTKPQVIPKGLDRRKPPSPSTSEGSSRESSQHLTTQKANNSGKGGGRGAPLKGVEQGKVVEQAGVQILPDGSSVIAIPHGRAGEGPVRGDSQSDLDKLKNELQYQTKSQLDQAGGKLSKKKSASKPINTQSKSTGRKVAVAKSKPKKSTAVNSSLVKGQQAKPPRAKVSPTKTKKKKTTKKMPDKDEKDGENHLAVETKESGAVSDILLRPSSEMVDNRLKVPSTMLERTGHDNLSESDKALTETTGSMLKVEDNRKFSRASMVMGSSSWEKQQARADERRLEVERKRVEKKRLLLEQQKEEEEKIRLLAEVEKAREESSNVRNAEERGELAIASSSTLEEDRNNEQEMSEEANVVEDDIPRRNQEELERLMRENELKREAERLKLEEVRLQEEQEKLRKEEERISRLRQKQEAEELKKKEEALRVQDEMARWKHELEGVRRQSVVQEAVDRLHVEVERAKEDSLAVKPYEGTVLTKPTYFSYFRYCPQIFEPPKRKPKNERGKRRSTLAK